MVRCLENKVCVVTGSGRGIGKAIAMLMAANGARLVVNDLGCAVDGNGEDTNPADEVTDQIKKAGGTAVANYDTVTTMQGGTNIIRAALKNYGRVDILVNNAGVFRPARLVDMTEEDWDTTISVHLKGHFCCSKAAASEMLKRGSGCIINVSSTGALGMAGASNYSSAKAGILGLTRALAKELGPQGMRVNAVMPQASTRMMEVALRQIAGPNRATSAFSTRTPDAAASLVVFLAGDSAAAFNGLTFHTRQDGIIDIYSDPSIARSLFKNGRWTHEDLARMLPPFVSGLGSPLPSHVAAQ